MKPHGKFLKLINLKIDGRLSPDEETRLMDHIEECDACRAEYEVLSHIRSKLLTAVDVPLNADRVEAATSKIMAAIRKKAPVTLKPRRSALKPALGFASLLIIFIISMAVLHKPAPSGKALFTNTDDLEFDVMLVGLLNEHEHLMAFEAFSDPIIIANEKEINKGIVREAIE
jgi:predicted anti-sigma-YlaC factor YlaD